MSYHVKNKKLRNTWNCMIQRCTNKNNCKYYNYGARGITVCAEWRIFKNFEKWAFENGYIEGLTIDRKDCNGNYEPSNCQWSTPIEQANNRRNNRVITLNGQTKTLSEFIRESEFCYTTIMYRLNQGVPPEKAFVSSEEWKKYRLATKLPTKKGKMCDCSMCGEHKEHRARNLCHSCYHRALVRGELQIYERRANAGK